MIKEFAVEPCVMATWTHFQSLFEDFGAGRGRLISEYPSDWIDRVDKLAGQRSPTVRAYAIKSKLRAHRDKLLPTRRAFDKGRDWLSNAERCMTSEPFTAIIAETNPRNADRILLAGEFPKDEEPYLARTQCKVERSGGMLAECAKTLLRVCREIQLVDPNFDPAEPRFVETFREIMALHSAFPQKLRVCEIHLAKKPGYCRENREHHLRRNLANFVPAGVTLRVHFWRQKPAGEKMHARFLLTEFGGLQYDYGLDEGEASGEKTIVMLIEHELWRQIRADYSVTGPTFEIAADEIIEIEGKR